MHLRSVAGVFVLSTGLLVAVGGAATATADSESAAAAGAKTTDTTTQGLGTTGSTATTATPPTTSPTAAQSDTDTTAATGVPHSGPTATTTGVTSNGDPSDSELAKQFTETDQTESAGLTTGSSAGSSATTTNSTPSPGPGVLAADSNLPAADSNAPAANSTVATSNSNVVAPEATTSPFAGVMAPVTNAINAIAKAVPQPPEPAAVQTVTAPMTDVITSVQQMLSTVAEVVAPLVALPGDLYTMLSIPQTPPSLIGDSGAVPAADDAAPLFGQGAGQLPAVAAPVRLGAPLFGTMTPPPALGVDGQDALALQQLSLSGMAQLAPEGIRPMDARSLLQHVVTAVLVPASLSALAALALPGIGGLLVVIAAGIRLGYRQAKAGLALRVAGIARFAGSGPMGVVRSGALISLHTRTPRASRAARAEAGAPTTVRHLERVA